MAEQNEIMMGKTRAVAISLLFVAYLWLPLVGRVFHLAPEYADTESRTLAKRPTFSWRTAARYPGRFERFYNDHFAFRQNLIRWHSMLMLYGLRVSPSDKVLLGKKGWYFYIGKVDHREDPLADILGTKPLSAEHLEQWRRVLEARRDWLAERGIGYLVVLVPNKARVYPEYLPDAVAPGRVPSPYGQFLAFMAERSDLSVLDLAPALRAAKPLFRLYHQTDPHWNSAGGFVGYQAIIRAAEPWMPGVVPWSTADVEVRPVHSDQGDLVKLMSLRGVLYEDGLSLVPLRPLRSTNKLEVKGREWSYYGSTGDTNLPRAVVLGDSFIGGLPPFFSEHFERTVYRATYGRFPVDMITAEQPLFVVEEVVERFLRERVHNPDVLRSP